MIVRRTAAVAGMGILVLAAAPTAGAEPPEGADSIDGYPFAQGNYTTPQDLRATGSRTGAQAVASAIRAP